MSINKQKYYALINNEDNSIFIIIKTISTNNFEEVINTIEFSTNFKKYQNINDSEEIQKVKFKLFGAEILELSNEEFETQVNENFEETFNSYNDLIIEKNDLYGLNKFQLSAGQNVKDFENVINTFAETFEYTITTNNL